MGLSSFVRDAIAGVHSTFLSGRKRKAPERDNIPLPVSSTAPLCPANETVQRLDFSSPAINGKQQQQPQQQHGYPADASQAPAAVVGQQQPRRRPSSAGGPALPSRLGPTPARRLDDTLTAATAATAAASALQLEASGQPAAQPFTKQFAPPSQHRGLPPLRASCQLVNGLRHVLQAPPSMTKLTLTPATQWHQQQQPLQPVRGLFTGGGNGSTHKQRQQQRHQRADSTRQRQGIEMQPMGMSAAQASADQAVQDAALLRRVVEYGLKQEELLQQRHQQQHQQQQSRAGGDRAEEVDLTREPSSVQRRQQQQGQQHRPQPWVRLAAAPGAGAAQAAGPARQFEWREMLLKVAKQQAQEGLSDLGGDAAPSSSALAMLDAEPAGSGQYRDLVADADLARRRALQAQEMEVQYVRQAHTALEQAQPGRAQRLEAEAAQLQQQLHQMEQERQRQQAHRRQQDTQQQQQPVPDGHQHRQQQKTHAAAPAAADDDDVVELLSSSDDEEGASVSLAATGSEEESEEESDVSLQLERVALDEGRAVLPVPDDWRQEYEAALAPGPAGEVLVDHSRSSIAVTRKDMACMAPLQWLNDEVINLYISLLLERDAARRMEGTGPRCHFFSTFFANKLYKDNGYSYDQVRRWTMPKRLASSGQASESILDVDRIVVPVHQGMHWVCAVIDLKHQKFVYYDSLKGEDQRCLEQLANYLRDEYANKRGLQRDDVLEWPREFPKRIPQQMNGCDCGVFTLLFANYVGRAASMTFSQAHIDDFRVRIVHEILQLRVE